MTNSMNWPKHWLNPLRAGRRSKGSASVPQSRCWPPLALPLARRRAIGTWVSRARETVNAGRAWYAFLVLRGIRSEPANDRADLLLARRAFPLTSPARLRPARHRLAENRCGRAKPPAGLPPVAQRSRRTRGRARYD